MGMRYYNKSLANLLFENETEKSDRQTFGNVLNGNFDDLAAAIAEELKEFGVETKTGSLLRMPKNQKEAEEFVADALRARLENATTEYVDSVSDVRVTPLGEQKPVVNVEVKFSEGSITQVPIGSTPLSSHDYIVLVDAAGYRWAPASDLIKFAQGRPSVKGKVAFSAEEFMSNPTEELYSYYPVHDITAGEYEYITKLIRSRIAKARGDTGKADVSYTMPFTIDGSKVRVDLKFESLFRKYISELLKE